MENKVLLKNLNAIAQYNKELANKILMFNIEKSNISIIETQQNEYNLFLENTPLHNQNGAIEEAKNIVSSIENKNDKNTIRLLYGLGLGYLLDEMSNQIKGSKIIVYEPNIELLKLVLSIAEIDAITNKNVMLCENENSLEKFVIENATIDSNLTISFLSSYKKLYENNIINVLRIAQKALGEYNANINTLKHKAPGAIRNSISNLKNIFKNPNVRDLKDIYKNKTALCLSAGPSLKDNIEIIKNNQDKFVIFAVNPTIKLLEQHGIKPDFIVNIEVHDTSMQFSTINPKEYYFILEAFCSCPTMSIDSKKTFNYISKNNFINPFIRNCLKLDDSLESFGTVSYSALMSAFVMGFDRIIVCGQDLAYKNGDCYAKGSQYGELKCVYNEAEKKFEIIPVNYDEYIKAFKSEYRTDCYAEFAGKNYLNFLNSNIFTVKSQTGEDIPSQTGYALFIKQFSSVAMSLKKIKPDLKLINSSIGGAQIDGFDNQNLEDIVQTLETIEKINLDNYEAKLDKKHATQKLEELKTELSVISDCLYELIEINKKIINEIKNKKIITFNVEKLLEKYKKIMNSIINLSKNENSSFIISTFMLKAIDLVNLSFGDCDELLQKLENNNPILENILMEFSNYTKTLSDCQSFIL